MTFPASLKAMMEDTVTIEPYVSADRSQAPSYGASVTYSALVEGGVRRKISVGGRDVESTVQVTIPDRVFVDQRSRITLPTGFAPQQPPILGVEHRKFGGLDHTVVIL